MKKKHLILLSTAFIIFFIDQLTKLLIKINLGLNESIPVINNIFHLTYIHNFGAGFGILQQQRFLLISVSIIVIGFILYYFKKIKNNEMLLQMLMGAVLGGTIGNLTDRVIYGYVADFIDFRIWPIFNIADSAVTIGIIGLIIYFWKK